jgi:E3 ubiquitin-protein ligase SHPRH
MENVLNAQCAILWEWRGEIYRMLTQSLTAEDGDANGEEYQASLNTQGRVEVYLQAYTALLADRREALSSERTLLAAHDARFGLDLPIFTFVVESNSGRRSYGIPKQL